MLSSKVDEVLANVHYTYIICDSRIHIFQTNSVHLMSYELRHLTTNSLIKDTQNHVENRPGTPERLMHQINLINDTSRTPFK